MRTSRNPFGLPSNIALVPTAHSLSRMGDRAIGAATVQRGRSAPRESILKIKIALVLTLLTTSPVVVGADDDSQFSRYYSSCPRPAVGSVTGACEVRNKRAAGVFVDNTESPYVIHKWWSCLQKVQELPCGCRKDGTFIGAFRFEWKREIDANLASLRKLLSPRDRTALDEEQKSWERALERGQKSRESAPDSYQSTHHVSVVIAGETPYNNRAIELACRVEKFSAVHVAEPNKTMEPTR